MRFIQNETTPKKEPKPKKKEVVIKAGNKDYDYANLTDTKKVLTGRGSF
jgi:glucan-binding YG repeat protein|tara:strand:+ start:38 stop:184 length:147 start_codon:yes stop_codon:yes gene_type:complete